MKRSLLPLAAAVLAFALAGMSTPAAAAETDPYYGWLYPPKDGRLAMNTAINRELERGLRDVNGWRRPTAKDVDAAGHAPVDKCAEVAAQVTAPLAPTAAWFWAGSTRSWEVDRSPRTRSEYVRRYRQEGTYRYSALLPFGSFVPFDPSVRVGNVVFGTDKIGHFFTNGLRGFQRYREERAGGATAAAAEREAVNLGMEEERGILGLGVSGIFSYADLEANDQGLRFFRDLCEGGDLVAAPDPAAPGKLAWKLARPFDIARYVDPCWDEGFYPSSFRDEHPIARAIEEKCDALLAARAARYGDAGHAERCDSAAVHILDGLRAVNAAPKPLTLDDVCHRAPAAPVAATARR